MHRFKAPLHVRLMRDFIWYLKAFLRVLPEVLNGICFGVLFILPQVIAAFFF